MALDPRNTEETGMKVRSNGLNDELSLVKYIFSDKTGNEEFSLNFLYLFVRFFLSNFA